MSDERRGRILLLSDPASVHTQRWARSLAERNFEIHLLGFTPAPENSPYLDHALISKYSLEVSHSDVSGIRSDSSKLAYFKVIPKLRQLAEEIKPDIVHAHYATSYGMLGSFAGKKPLAISLWGDDVLIFPKKSFFHAAFLKFNLWKSDYLFSTSKVLASCASDYTSKEIQIIPFGIDAEKMAPRQVERPESLKNHIVIGTIKSLEHIYGIDYLIQAFSLLVKALPEIPLKLLIVGGGSCDESLKNLARQLGVFDKTLFIGKVPHSEVVTYQNMLDIYVALSRSESFGVAPLEAQSCGKPVVVSDCGGLPEVIANGMSGFVVPTGDVQLAMQALKSLVLNQNLRNEMGSCGRNRVITLFSWEKNVDLMVSWYDKMLGKVL